MTLPVKNNQTVDPRANGVYKTEAERVFNEEDIVLTHKPAPEWIKARRAAERGEDVIVAQQREDTWTHSEEGKKVPFVIFSTHPDFVDGTRFDYGMVQAALKDGYHVCLLNSIANEKVVKDE